MKDIFWCVKAIMSRSGEGTQTFHNYRKQLRINAVVRIAVADDRWSAFKNGEQVNMTPDLPKVFCTQSKHGSDSLGRTRKEE